VCGRFTYKLTWEEIVKLYRLTLDQHARNTQPRYNICPTTTIDTVVSSESKRALVSMRWGLIPYWWNKPLKEMRLAISMHARKPSQPSRCFATRSKQALSDTRERLLRVARCARRKAAVLFHAPRRSADHIRGPVVELE
jgi:putative SOS response-associated peptidase YedK